jgi:hypothetical protein
MKLELAGCARGHSKAAAIHRRTTAMWCRPLRREGEPRPLKEPRDIPATATGNQHDMTAFALRSLVRIRKYELLF